MMGHDSLANVLKSNFNLMHHHRWSLSDVEGMMPWEKYIYVDMLNAWVKEQDDLAKQQETEYKNMMSQLNRRRR
jgi:hypothetical protein